MIYSETMYAKDNLVKFFKTGINLEKVTLKNYLQHKREKSAIKFDTHRSQFLLSKSASLLMAIYQQKCIPHNKLNRKS